MIPHPHLTAEKILHMLRMPGQLPRKVSGPPGTDAERAHAQAKLIECAQDPDAHLLVLCVACEAQHKLTETHPCVCGGFVCPACYALEGEGRCDHEPLQPEPGDTAA